MGAVKRKRSDARTSTMQIGKYDSRENRDTLTYRADLAFLLMTLMFDEARNVLLIP